MIARKAKKLAVARKRLQELTPAELTAVSGGWRPHHRRHHHHHHHHKRFPFV
jgi:hypothetical protein